jgi:hypothetical protein
MHGEGSRHPDTSISKRKRKEGAGVLKAAEKNLTRSSRFNYKRRNKRLE